MLISDANLSVRSVAVTIHLTTWVTLGSAYQNAFNPRAIGVVPCLVIVNIMACRMFRQLHREQPASGSFGVRSNPQQGPVSVSIAALQPSRSRASSSARTINLTHSREKMMSDIEEPELGLQHRPSRSGSGRSSPVSGWRTILGFSGRGSYIGDISHAVDKDVIEIQVSRTVEMSRL